MMWWLQRVVNAFKNRPDKFWENIRRISWMEGQINQNWNKEFGNIDNEKMSRVVVITLCGRRGLGLCPYFSCYIMLYSYIQNCILIARLFSRPSVQKHSPWHFYTATILLYYCNHENKNDIWYKEKFASLPNRSAREAATTKLIKTNNEMNWSENENIININEQHYNKMYINNNSNSHWVINKMHSHDIVVKSRDDDGLELIHSFHTTSCNSWWHFL